MSNLKEVLTVVANNDGFPGLGFKAAAQASQTKPTTMRYALQAWNGGLISAVVLGTITDGRVVGELHALPKVACETVGRVETRLKRHLSRERAHSIVTYFRMQASISRIERMMERSVDSWCIADAIIKKDPAWLHQLPFQTQGEIRC